MVNREAGLTWGQCVRCGLWPTKVVPGLRVCCDKSDIAAEVPDELSHINLVKSAVRLGVGI